MHKGKDIIAKCILIYAPIINPIVNIILLKSIPNHQYYGMVGNTTISIFLVAILFEIEREKIIFWCSLLLIFLYSAFFDTILVILSKEPPKIDFLLENYVVYKSVHFTLISVIVSITIFLKRLLYSYQQKINIKNKALHDINQNLELLVKEKTKKILASKNKIAELAFLTSHSLRGPLSSILGVTQILREDIDDDDVIHILPELYHQAEKMEIVIIDMNNKIQEELDVN